MLWQGGGETSSEVWEAQGYPISSSLHSQPPTSESLSHSQDLMEPPTSSSLSQCGKVTAGAGPCSSRSQQKKGLGVSLAAQMGALYKVASSGNVLLSLMKSKGGTHWLVQGTRVGASRDYALSWKVLIWWREGAGMGRQNIFSWAKRGFSYRTSSAFISWGVYKMPLKQWVWRPRFLQKSTPASTLGCFFSFVSSDRFTWRPEILLKAMEVTEMTFILIWRFTYYHLRFNKWLPNLTTVTVWLSDGVRKEPRNPSWPPHAHPLAWQSGHWMFFLPGS